MNIEKIIITKYEIDKSRLKKMISSDAGMCDYIDSLSNFTKNQNKLNGRIIVKYKHVVNNEGDSSYTYYTYATIGVNL